MGRKKKKTMKPWCWYCNREFEDEKILLQHQKAKHFKCHICHKKLYTGPGLQIHCMQVHKENIEKVPNSIKGRDNITLEICGMENIPEEDLIEHERQKTISATRDDESDSDDDRHSNHQPGPPSWAPPVPPPPPPPPPPPQSQNPQQPPIPPLLPPMPQIANAASATPPTPGMPPNPAMMQQMMMMYPQMAQMMAMNPMMMQQMMGGMINPQHPSSAPPQPPQPPPPPSSAPKPLMSLMEVNPKPMFDNAPKIPKPLFPAAANEYANQLKNQQSQLTDLSFVPKVENTLPGSRIIHPEDDISLEEFRASHHKYKYSLPQYSAPPEPINNAHQHRDNQNPYHHTQMSHNSYGRNGNRYH